MSTDSEYNTTDGEYSESDMEFDFEAERREMASREYEGDPSDTE